jgi:tRNA(Ile)-lysidine synthase
LRKAVSTYAQRYLADENHWCVALSGGPDSLALTAVAAEQRPTVALVVDHGLQPDSSAVAQTAASQALDLGCDDARVLTVEVGRQGGPEAAARAARYAVLREASAGASVLLGHTLDDQAETVLIRLTRGSGVSGLAAMARIAPVPGSNDIALVRPLLELRKAELLATLRKARIAYAEDPSNRDPRFTRARLRAAMPALQREGLNAERLALLAHRVRRAEAALEAVVDGAVAALAPEPWPDAGPIAFPAVQFGRLPAEVTLRLLGRAIAYAGNEGPVELAKLEALHVALAASSGSARFRRTLAGAVVTRFGDRLWVERAPARHKRVYAHL